MQVENLFYNACNVLAHGDEKIVRNFVETKKAQRLSAVIRCYVDVTFYV